MWLMKSNYSGPFSCPWTRWSSRCCSGKTGEWVHFHFKIPILTFKCFNFCECFEQHCSRSTRRASPFTRQQLSIGPMSTLALTIGYLQYSNITCFMIIKEESFHSNAAYLTEYLLTNHSPAPRVWGNVETAARHGRWGGDLDFHFFLDLKSKRGGPEIESSW